MLTEIRHILLWPPLLWTLRSAGLDPGRALANASPSPAEREAARRELWEHVQTRFPTTPDRTAPLVRSAR